MADGYLLEYFAAIFKLENPHYSPISYDCAYELNVRGYSAALITQIIKKLISQYLNKTHSPQPIHLNPP